MRAALLLMLVAAPAMADDWPAAEGARGGVLNLPVATLRALEPGLSKRSIYPLLGPPQYAAGLFARTWHYRIGIRNAADNGMLDCLLRLRFEGRTLKAVEWQEPKCAARLAPQGRARFVRAVALPTPVALAGPGAKGMTQVELRFAPGSAALSAAAQRVVADAAAKLDAPVQRVIVVGGGKPPFDAPLAEKRAAAIAAMLSDPDGAPPATGVEMSGERVAVILSRDF
ncbi:hypothetical protein [Sandaracinobacteroides saxicola]|uniref:hypothetical protein n=1 Tax=Sandaracinobacteroides saxicola TaxID=2759707 RepID=UPI0021E16825|nr:hypothetical protein [Sandaracinobacteroides saxicola]